jgi:hypothetical protein
MKSQLLARLTLLSYSLCHGWFIILFVGVTHSMLVISNAIAVFLNRHKKNLRDSKLQTIFTSANSIQFNSINYDYYLWQLSRTTT